MSRFLRYLQIAFSATCLIACVLLIALWVRSYSHLTTTQILVTRQTRYYLHSLRGTVVIQRWFREFSVREFMPMFRESNLSRLTTNAGFSIGRSQGIGIESVSVSYWLLSVVTIVIATVPWIFWRFSLRTLLIATTLVAVVLGVIMWQVRQ